MEGRAWMDVRLDGEWTDGQKGLCQEKTSPIENEDIVHLLLSVGYRL